METTLKATLAGYAGTELTGQRFGKLVAQWPCGKTRFRAVIWLCLCDCGNIKTIRANSLKTENTKSCGCLYKNSPKNAITHGHASGGVSPEYRAYQHAKSRCTDRNVWNYKNYGGRGIEFRFDSFDKFLSELGSRPSSRHSIDRINNDGHYEIGNVRWATPLQQRHNRRRREAISQ